MNTKLKYMSLPQNKPIVNVIELISSKPVGWGRRIEPQNYII